MNEHILLVMKFLDDKNSVRKQELLENASAADSTARAVYDTTRAVYDAARVVYSNTTASDAASDATANAAANAAANADASDAANDAANAASNSAAYAADAVYAAAAYADAEKSINRYFGHTKEDKQTYIDAINAGKEGKEMKSGRLADEIMVKSKESVYTQEMKDNSEVPVVGMMVLSRGEALEVISVYHIADAKVLTLFNSKTSGVRALYFKTAGVINIDAIDQRTDSEKAIDDLVLQISRVQYDANMSDMALKDIIAVAFETGVSFTGGKK